MFAKFLLRTLLAVLLISTAFELSAAAPRKRVNRNAKQNEAAKEKALNAAIKSTKSRLAAAERTLAAISADALKKQAEAGRSAQRADIAKSDAAGTKNAADAALFELKELQANIETEQPEGSEYRKAKAAYEGAVEDLAEERLEIYESLDYQAKYAIADKAPNRLEAIERVTEEFFGIEEEYQEALHEAESAKRAFTAARLAIYKANPEWEARVKAARETYGEQAVAENAFDAAAVDRGLDNINLRSAGKRLSAAQAAVADAQADLKKLEARKKKAQPAKSTAPQKNKAKKK